MAIIEKKVWPQFFDDIVSGKKKFELRLHDFEITEGDTLLLKEWDPHSRQYTGRTIEKKITYVLKFKLGDFGQQEQIKEKGLMVISFE